MIVYIALAALAVLAALSALATARRHQSAKAIGMASEQGQATEHSPGTPTGAELSVGSQAGQHTDSRVGERLSFSLGGRASAEGRQVEQTARTAGIGASSGEVATGRGSRTEPYVPADPEIIGVSRRQFFNRTIITLMGMSLSSFGMACIAFLWPQGASGFGSKIKVGLVSDLLSEIRDSNGFLYKPEGRMWLTEYPNGAVEKAEAAYSPAELAGMTAGQKLGLDGGIVALYQKCPHLGCRVPECVTSQWFECPCHGSKYNQVGEKRGGPAPRGMDRFAVEIAADGSLVVDTGTIIQGPPIGTNTTGQEAEGPNCIGQATSH